MVAMSLTAGDHVVMGAVDRDTVALIMYQRDLRHFVITRPSSKHPYFAMSETARFPSQWSYTILSRHEK